MLLFVLKTITRFVSRLRLETALRLGRGIGWFIGSVFRYHRKDALDALTRAFPEKSAQEINGIVSAMYANLGMNLIESLRLAGGRKEQVEGMIAVSGKEVVDQALARGKGVLLLTAHLGNWDLLSIMSLVAKLPPLTIISKDVKNKQINDFWMGMRKEYGLKIVPAHNSYRACRAALKNNEMVGFILDQNMIDKEGVFVDFFGRPACTTPGLAFMAAQSGAPIVPVCMHRTGGGCHEIRALPVIEPPSDREPETIRAATQHYTKILEDMIREHPEQWIWIHRRWRTKPKPEGANEKSAG